jgi:hypothetical protein
MNLREATPVRGRHVTFGEIEGSGQIKQGEGIERETHAETQTLTKLGGQWTIWWRVTGQEYK